jgi:hypothetical protein
MAIASAIIGIVILLLDLSFVWTQAANVWVDIGSKFGFLIALCIAFIFLLVTGLAAGIPLRLSLGLLRKENWARIVAIVVAAILVASSIYMVAKMAEGGFRMAMVPFAIAVCALPTWWLIALNRKTTREQFKETRITQRPLLNGVPRILGAIASGIILIYFISFMIFRVASFPVLQQVIQRLLTLALAVDLLGAILWLLLFYLPNLGPAHPLKKAPQGTSAAINK